MAPPVSATNMEKNQCIQPYTMVKVTHLPSCCGGLSVRKKCGDCKRKYDCDRQQVFRQSQDEKKLKLEMLHQKKGRSIMIYCVLIVETNLIRIFVLSVNVSMDVLQVKKIVL